ncbi:hypothetical protein AX15_002745 [Amanita polypyramis BW_CC]|nr:hypothetical protein AX15_002745 [Amanita polypyramis BW_CC]
MSLRVVRKLLKSLTLRNVPSDTQPPLLESDWLDDIIKITRIIASASDLTPFPHVKGAASIFIALLEPIQQMQKNKDHFRELAEEVCKLLVMLRDRVIQHQSTISLSEEFTQLCIEFAQCLLDIQSQMNEMMRQQSVRMRGYFKASVVQALLVRYKVQMESLRMNFMMLNVFDMRVQITDIRSLLDSCIPSRIPQQQVANYAIAEGDMSDYRQIRIGDLQVLTEPLLRKRSAEIAVFTEDFVVKVEDAKKTLRVYRGQDALHTLRHDFDIKCKLRHPYIAQLFGVSSSRHLPGLIFYGGMPSSISVRKGYWISL